MLLARGYGQNTGVCGQGMSNVFAAPPIKYFKIFLGYQSLNITLTLNPNPISDPNPKNKRKQNDT